MNAFSQIDVNSLTAIDVHVHLEPLNDASPTDAAARKYFGDSGASRDHKALAEYYRSRKIAFVIFAVDERLTGRTHVSNDEVIRFAQGNADVAIPFASIDPHRGPEGVREAKHLVSEGVVRGLKLHPPVQQFTPNDPFVYPLYEVFAEARLPVVFHTGHSGIGTGMPAGGGIRLKYGNPCPSTTKPSILRICRSLWPIRPSHGRMRQSPSVFISPMFTSTFRAGRPNIFRLRSLNTRTLCSRIRFCLARTIL